MDDSTRSVLRAVMEKFRDLSYILPEDVPDIPLYMDQITTFMDSKLGKCKRYPDEKILTKTMINNYTKNRLIPPPEKKKYSQEHLFLLIYVYYLKDFLSINDIKTLLTPLEDNHFETSDDLSMKDIYQAAYDLVRGQTGYMSKDLLRRWKMAEKTFPDASDESKGFLHLFAFICLLSFDVYVKKKLIEAAVDGLRQEEAERASEEAEKKEKEKQAAAEEKVRMRKAAEEKTV